MQDWRIDVLSHFHGSREVMNSSQEHFSSRIKKLLNCQLSNHSFHEWVSCCDGSFSSMTLLIRRNKMKRENDDVGLRLHTQLKIKMK
mmetsp:Transcript_3027/g.3526  ORF Transcript_3027/g.3526 Transcript_3027/m.3526 type:complete len:87 (+) Transcript_3027:884-1144(+)